ncbi:MAG TPA: hypothetical protein VGV92_01595 [Gammaproteobacteria bacterium]|nr:hypothetical protein [Gammaproteobacteria bacterium]
MEEVFGNNGGNNNNNSAEGDIVSSGTHKTAAVPVASAAPRAIEVSSVAAEASEEEIKPDQRYAEFIRQIKAGLDHNFFKQSSGSSDAKKTFRKVKAIEAQINGLRQQIIGLELEKERLIEKLETQLETNNIKNGPIDIKTFGKNI